MFDDHSPDHPLRKFTQQDLLASGLRVALSAAGPFGVIVGEFLTQFVPAQRLDRLQQFVDCLAERLGGLESVFRERVSSSPSYAACSPTGCCWTRLDCSTRKPSCGCATE